MDLRRFLSSCLLFWVVTSHPARELTAQGSSADRSGPVRFEPALALEAVLPQSSVYDILEDREGFLWFATREGVARWDGREVRTWRHDPFDRSSVPGNIVRTVRQDGRGDVWISAYDYLEHPAGVARIEGPDFTVVHRYDAPNAAVAFDRDGLPLLVTADSILSFDSAADAFRPWKARARPRPPDHVLRRPPYTVTTDAGRLWIVDSEATEQCPLPGGPCVEAPGLTGSLASDQSGRLWAAAPDGVLQLDTDGHIVERIPIPGFERPVVSVAVDAAGTVWALAEEGVVAIRGGVPSVAAPLPNVGDRSTLAPVVLHVDRAQNIWVGTVWGVFVHEAARKAFRHLEYDPDNRNSLGSGQVAALAEGPEGEIWIGTIGGGLNRWDRATGEILRFRHSERDPRSLSDDVVWDLVLHAGDLWAGTSYGLTRIDLKARTFRPYQRDPRPAPVSAQPSRNSFQDLEPDPSGRLWLTCPAPCTDTLTWFDSRTSEFRSQALPGVGELGYLALAPDGRLWIGAQDGILRLSVADQQVEPLATEGGDLDGALTYHFARTGDVWVGTNSGLYRFGPDDTLRSRLTTEDGLPSNAVYGVLQDDRRRLWLSTNRGLALVDPDEPEGRRVRAYDPSTGLRNTEFNRQAYLQASDGTLFFGGDRGVTWFDPREIRDNPYAPPVVVTAFERATQTGAERLPLGLGASVTVRPADYTFAFEFAALSYVNPHRNRYQVLLDGFDAQWRELGTAGRATYTNVPPGSYTFRVRGSNEDGLWGPHEATVAVVVEPWLWQTAWFRAMAVVLLAVSVAGATMLALRARYRIQLAHARAEQALERERTRLSRDMHDEVGASLTEIAILSDLAMEQAAEHPPLSMRMARIGEKSRAALDAIGGIIWAIDPVADGAAASAYLREHAAEVLESAGLRAELSFPSPLHMPRMTAETRRTLLLVLKESLANVLRHAHASWVRVRLAVEHDCIRLQVVDNGRGLDASAQDRPGHHGLRNMTQRARAAGGSVVVAPRPGGGTEVTLTLPLDPQTP